MHTSETEAVCYIWWHVKHIMGNEKVQRNTSLLMTYNKLSFKKLRSVRIVLVFHENTDEMNCELDGTNDF